MENKASKEILSKFIYISIATAILTIALKYIAFLCTNSLGMLSDALESIVNLVAAFFALQISNYAHKPADDDHAYGHHKAEYFSGIIEGLLILLAGVLIVFTAIQRLIHPEPVSINLIGVSISMFASLLNLGTALLLLKKAAQYKSIILEADGHHLLTDVYTSVGVLFGIILIPLTKITVIDQVIAIMIGFWITLNALKIVRKSILGLMDTAISQQELAIVMDTLKKYERSGISYHKIFTRQAGMQAFLTGHILVPENWSVKKAHKLAHTIEREIKKQLDNIDITFHIEPKK